MRIPAALLAASLLALLAPPLICEIPSPMTLHASSDPLEWKVAASIPAGPLYHVVWKDPVSRCIQALVRLPPGFRTKPHPHKFNETVVVLRGKLKVKVGNAERVLRRGDYAVFPVESPHEVSVAGRWEVQMLVTLVSPDESEYKTLEGLFGG